MKRILVVEDEPSISQVCVRTLASEGFLVDTAANGLVAQGKLLQKDYDLILIDVRTPLMNGKQLYHHISEKHPELVSRIVFTTGDVLGSDTQHFIGDTGCLHLPKPFAPSALRAKVKEALSRQK